MNTSKGETPISDVKAGDYVLAYNEKSDTTGWYPVTDTSKHEDKTIVHLVIDDEKITTTPEHPFFTEEKGWVDAVDLKTDMHIRKAEGTYGEVKSVTIEASPREMYNLSVDTAHTYFVGDGQWLVHNLCSNEEGSSIPEADVPDQVHHFATDKSGKWTPSYNKIVKKYDLNLDEEWNKELMPHQGRHPDAYHQWVLDQLNKIDKELSDYKGEDRTELFLNNYKERVVERVLKNPLMLKPEYWKNLP